jgi:D-galactose 1-dehydrogenase
MMNKPIRMGILGVGKIARDQHIPSIAGNRAFHFVAAASRHGHTDGVENFHTLEEMLTGVPDLDAVAVCTPPQTHYDAGKLALRGGKHVLMEKPPCTSLAQLAHLETLAGTQGVTLYQTWHSRHAHGVRAAAELLGRRHLRRVAVTWKEDVRVWHPGQTWIWETGGFGVFDPGINALSILTHLIAEPLFATAATFYVPSNCATPIAASGRAVSERGLEVSLELDFRHTGVQTWDIDFDTDEGPIKLSAGGAQLSAAGVPMPPSGDAAAGEYPSIYAHFAELIAANRSDVDARPMQLVADLFFIARHVSVEPFVDSR